MLYIDVMYKIYLDLDQVLGDFDSRFIQLSNGVTPKEYESKYGIAEFWKLIDNEGVSFWVGIPFWEEGKKLFQYTKKYKPLVLSAPSRHYTSRFGKKVWMKQWLPNTPLILCPAIEKQKYADPNSILIDDNSGNIERWRAANGIGILFTSTDQAIKELKKLKL